MASPSTPEASSPASALPSRFDVAIAGAGPVGLTLALGLASQGFSVVVVDPDAGDGRRVPSQADARAYFVAFGCWRIWRALGLEPALIASAEPVTSVAATGAGGGGGIAFLAEDCKNEPVLGYMIEHAPLVDALQAAALTTPGVSVRPGRVVSAAFGEPTATLLLEHGELHAALIIACDGVRSGVRRAAGLRYEGFDYPASAISAIVATKKPHGGAARQIFLPSGPLAALPLTHDRLNLVWSERAGAAQALMALSDQGFAAELARRAGDFLDGVDLRGPRAAFPLGLHIAERFHGRRLALAGDSAHQIPPLAGQGLNLGLKDVAALIDIVVDASAVGLDIGAEAALAPYTRWRRADIVGAAAAMDSLSRIFTAPSPIRAVAGLAMQAVGAFAPARRFFAREAGGVLGDLPRLMRASAKAAL